MPDKIKIKVAVVGLGFGAEFIPIYQRHPDAELWAICKRDEKGLHEIGDQFGVERRYTDLKALLADPEVDAITSTPPLRPTLPCRWPPWRQANTSLHGAYGDDRGRMPPDSGGPSPERKGVYDDGNSHLHP